MRHSGTRPTGRQRGLLVDITDVILRQHDEQRRMFAALEEWPRDDHEGLAAVWKRLEILLEVHAEAEERYFYPELLRIGTGGADAESVDEEVEDAIKDHNNIRESVPRWGAATPGPMSGGRPWSTPTCTTATTWARRSART